MGAMTTSSIGLSESPPYCYSYTKVQMNELRVEPYCRIGTGRGISKTSGKRRNLSSSVEIV